MKYTFRISNKRLPSPQMLNRLTKDLNELVDWCEWITSAEFIQGIPKNELLVQVETDGYRDWTPVFNRMSQFISECWMREDMHEAFANRDIHTDVWNIHHMTEDELMDWFGKIDWCEAA